MHIGAEFHLSPEEQLAWKQVMKRVPAHWSKGVFLKHFLTDDCREYLRQLPVPEQWKRLDGLYFQGQLLKQYYDSPNANRMRGREQRARDLKPLLRAIHYDRPHQYNSKSKLCHRAAEVLEEVNSRDGEYLQLSTNVSSVAREVLSKLIIHRPRDGFKLATLRDWYTGIDFDELIADRSVDT